MITDTVEALLSDCAADTELRLSEYIRTADADIKSVYDAMAYSTFAGGKRVRPALVLEFSRLLSGSRDVALSFAAAIEMVHTYSLIHDDLPCMDSDDYRRGKLTNHNVFGEATATLAGDALLTMAFYVIADSGASPEQITSAVRALSCGAGADGMIGGQIIDMESEGKRIEYEKLLKLHAKKTGALISCAARLGCIAAGADEDMTHRAVRYAEKIGLVFQIIDDILDKKGNFATLGKSIGSDDENEKSTFLSFMSAEDAMSCAERITAEATAELSDIPGSDNLIALAEYLLRRTK